MTKLKNFLGNLALKFGYKISKTKQGYPKNFSEEDISLIKSIRPFTMTGPERIFSLIESVRYVISNDIPGSIVECGVWRGGSMMAVAYTLLKLNRQDRDLYLYDTFEGMSNPTSVDISSVGNDAKKMFEETKIDANSSRWCNVSLDEVKKAVYRTGYHVQKIHFVKGKVENSLPKNVPRNISILRLDTDWYESTRHELIHLFPLLSHGGVIIIDDYGFWKGQRKAVDEYFIQNKIKILLNRIDNAARIGIKI